MIENVVCINKITFFDKIADVDLLPQKLMQFFAFFTQEKYQINLLS
jgi:hypothetical protein